MKYGNLTLGYCSWGFRETPLEKQLEIVSRDGLDVLELGIHGHDNDYLQLSPSNEQIDTVKALFNKYGVKLWCASTGNDFTEDSETACLTAVNNVKNVIETCGKLGIKYLRIFAGFSHVEDVKGERFNRLNNCLNEVYAYAENYGVIPVIETHGGVDGYDDGVVHFNSVSTNISTIKEIKKLVPSAVFNFDPANVSAVGVDNLVDFYNEIESFTSYFHLKDFKKLESGHLKPTYCGNGAVDFSKLLKVISTKNAPALFEYENVEDIEYGLKQCLNHVLSIN